ncbi:MAG TPA: hypothetical protein VK165_07995 [Azonexus sp.]|nr:hypothetical protein [Azonexus sp.]
MFINNQNEDAIGSAEFSDAQCQAAAEFGLRVRWPFSPVGDIRDFFFMWCGT